MMAFAFYLFAICVVVSGFMVVISRNPVHSVLWLILAFLSAAGLFVLLGAEFDHGGQDQQSRSGERVQGAGGGGR